MMEETRGPGAHPFALGGEAGHPPPFAELVRLACEGDGHVRLISREACAASARIYSAERRAAARMLHEEGESGSDIVHMLSDTADTILRGAFLFAMAHLEIPRATTMRLCLCALGGYGRAQLNPYSDLDVCLLYEGRLDQHIKEMSNFLVPFLWDAGFLAGYAIRSVKETQQLAQEDTEAFTSMLEARLLCGDSTVFARMKLHVRELQAVMSEAFIERKLRDRFEDLQEEYASLFAPQPNVKENAGGLRDFHTALWLLMMSHGIHNMDEALAQGVISSDEQLEFVSALDFLWRVRNELHFRAGMADDNLTFKNQRHVAVSFGYAEEHHSGQLQFMQEYYGAAAKLRRFLTIVARVCNHAERSAPPILLSEEAEPFVIRDGQLSVGLQDRNWFTHMPARLMEVYWRCARHEAHLSRYTERLVMENLHLVNEAFRSSDLVRRFFIGLCNRPLQAGPALRQASAVGLLGRYIPEFGEIQGVLRYEDFHHYPVDEHTIRAVEALGLLDSMEGPVGRCLREALDHLSDPSILVMAILFHDLGKSAGEAHVEEGVVRSRRICQRIGISADDEERIVFLVQHHMLMNTISQYRDVDDEHIVQSFVETVQSEQRLRALFLLSFADLYAVGPNVWNEWKGALLLQLYLRTVKRLLGRVETIGEEYWLTDRADDVRRLARDVAAEEVDAHLRGLGQRYFLAFPPEQIARHIECACEARETGLALLSRDEPERGYSEIVISTQDRHGLFSMLAGAFSSQLLDVSNAALFTRPDGIVVDCFMVTDVRQRRPLTKAQVKGIERILREVLLEGASISAYVEKSRSRLFALLQPRIPVQTRIEFDNHSSRNHTVIDIQTGDRTGLLYDVTRAMSEAGLDISSARIITDARIVRDSFYVSLDGRKLETTEEQEAVRERLHLAIHPRTTADTAAMPEET